MPARSMTRACSSISSSGSMVSCITPMRKGGVTAGIQSRGGRCAVLQAIERPTTIACVAPGLPTGTVTFLFTDVEGSTALLDELGAEDYAEALLQHRRALRDTFARHDGVEVDTQGDAFFVAFESADDAL